MSIFPKAGVTRFYRVSVNTLRERILTSRFWPIGIAVGFSLAIALLIYGEHVADFSIPIDGDVRAHIFKIDIVYNYLSHFSWPEWIPYWYHGYPFDLYYPPGFYILGAGLTAIVRNAVTAYKLLLFLALISNGLVTYFFARRFLKLNATWSVLCLIAYESSTPLLVNYLYGEGPNLIGWSLSIVFLTIYLGNVGEGKTGGLSRILLPGFLLGMAILIHPFPVIFVSMAIGIYHLIRLIHERSFATFLKLELPYLLAVFLTGTVIGTYYWLPAALNLKYASSIYTMTEYMWPGGMTYVLILCALALAVGLAVRLKVAPDLRLDFLIACLFLAMALGLGATRYFPLGLGVLLHEFRFATIMAPFLAVLLLFFSLGYKPVSLDRQRLKPAFICGTLLVLFIFVWERKNFLDFITGQLFSSSLDATIRFLADFPQTELWAIIVAAGLSSIVFFTVFAQSTTHRSNQWDRHILLSAASACFIMITSVVPLAFTFQNARLNRLFTYIRSYETPSYGEIMEKAQDGRLIVSMIKGSLCEGDSPVTFGWRWGVATVNGPYSQGDPKFFRHTVHLEWEDRWLDTRYTRENLMQESAARYIFVRNPRPNPVNMDGLEEVEKNEYGSLLELKGDVSHAAAVTPVLLDVADPDNIADFFNILVPKGYKLVFADASKIDAGLKARFGYALTDDEKKLAGYRDKQVLLIQNIKMEEGIGFSESDCVATFRFPYQEFINRYFYHGERGNGMEWVFFDNWKDAKLGNDQLTKLDNAAGMMRVFLNRLEYQPAGYRLDGNKIQLTTRPGFTLVKDSYFPYWHSLQGQIMPTSQGFMLFYSDNADVTLNYQKPAINVVATVITLITFTGVAIALVAMAISHARNKDNENINPAGSTIINTNN